ncbi:hypothetical protein F0726_00992 [Acidithiobacillus caldus]|nr:hypothetical protein F0726_00992 [Acidithiobacillus caldus]
MKAQKAIWPGAAFGWIYPVNNVSVVISSESKHGKHFGPCFRERSFIRAK